MEENHYVEDAYRRAMDLYENSNITDEQQNINKAYENHNIVNGKPEDGGSELTTKTTDSDADFTRIEKLIECFGNAASDHDDGDDDNYSVLNVKKPVAKKPNCEGLKVIKVVKKPTCFQYLKNVFEGRRYSERHKIFMKGSWSDRNILKFSSGIGPLDECQVQDVYVTLSEYFLKIAPDGTVDNPSSYVFDVLLPEAIIFALQKIRKIKKQEAENIYREMTLSKWSSEYVSPRNQ